MMHRWLDAPPDTTPDYVHSTLRERIVEHLFIAGALQRLWQLGLRDVEVLRAEFDAGGYDLVMSVGSMVRYIQFKTTTDNGKAASTKIGLKLMNKPSGCVLWIIVNSGLEPQSYLWFGGLPGEALPDISSLKVARHSKANVAGVKAERPGHRVVPRSRFDKLGNLDDVLQRLFGPLVQAR